MYKFWVMLWLKVLKCFRCVFSVLFILSHLFQEIIYDSSSNIIMNSLLQLIYAPFSNKIMYNSINLLSSHEYLISSAVKDVLFDSTSSQWCKTAVSPLLMHWRYAVLH